MFKKNAIILGGSSLNDGVYDKLKELGFYVAVVDYRENIKFKSDAHIVFDATDIKLASLLRSHGYENIKIVYTSMDSAGLAQRAICKEYGLLHTSEEAMLNAHHKNLMHKKWADAGLLNRQSIALSDYSYEQIHQINRKYKIIVKPSDACASRGVTCLEQHSSKQELKLAFDHAQKFSTTGYVNIEEYITGTEFTIEMLGDNFNNVTVFAISEKYHSNNTKGVVATKLHYNSAKFSSDFFERLANFGITCYKNLDLKNVFGHLEVLVKPNGTISPVEIGARSSGYIASHLTDFSANASYLEALANVQNGGKIQNGLIKQSGISSMYFFYDFPIDIAIKRKTHLMNFLDNVTTHAFDRQNIIVGQSFKLLEQDTDRFGFEIISGLKNVLTLEYIIKAEQKMLRDMFYD